MNFCSQCGQSMTESTGWPKRCQACAKVFFRNPLPVSVVLIPVDQGVLTVRRAIAPRQGELALPGGFVDFQESWQQAACREAWEETSLRLQPSELELLEAVSVEGGHLLLFSRCRPRTYQQVNWSYSCPEVSQLTWCQEPVTLAFPTHSEVLARHFLNSKNC